MQIGALLLGVAQVACGAPQAEPEPIDVIAELDRLYGCALLEVAQAEYEVASASRERRVLTTAWRSADGAERERARLQMTVFLHDWYGPGLTVLHARDAWVGELAPDLAMPTLTGEAEALEGLSGWRPQPATPEDARIESEMSARVQRCWQAARGEGEANTSP